MFEGDKHKVDWVLKTDMSAPGEPGASIIRPLFAKEKLNFQIETQNLGMCYSHV